MGATPEEESIDEIWRKSVETRLAASETAAKILAEKHDHLAQAVTLNNAQTQHMFEIFMSIENAFKLIGKIYTFSHKVFSAIAKFAKPLVWIFGLFMAVITFIKTGAWNWKP